MTAPDDPLTALAQHLTRAERALQKTAGGRSMCAIGRSGHSFPAAKYHEGATSALRELRRTLQRQPDQDDTTGLARLVRATASQWRERGEGPMAASPDWRAYLTGGAEALDELAEELGRSGQPGVSVTSPSRSTRRAS
jgi:hypothetical protein